MNSQKAVNAARVRDARIEDRCCESLIREERENPAFPFPWSEKFRIELFATLLSLGEKGTALEFSGGEKTGFPSNGRLMVRFRMVPHSRSG